MFKTTLLKGVKILEKREHSALCRIGDKDIEIHSTHMWDPFLKELVVGSTIDMEVSERWVKNHSGLGQVQ